MSAHTPEPWAIDPDDRPGMEWNNHIVPANSPGRTICFMSHDGTEENVECQANARRIVACVNACAGLPQDALDGGWTSAGMSAYAKSLEVLRDDLLAALDFYTNPNVYEPDALGRRDDITFVARAAIAKVKP